MALIVEKFGGSSVADTGRVKAVAKRIADTVRQGNKVVAVVSAQGKTTDALLQKARELSENPSAREMDQLLSAGEQISAALCAMALQEEGIQAVSLTAWQAGLFTDGIHGNAMPTELICARISQELTHGRVPVVAGFQGIDQCGDITTLGRGGSDTTAVALAHALNADHCLIFTDVDGVYTADPRTDPAARKLQTVSFEKMLAMANNGAKVLHSRSVELAERYQIEIEVRSSFSDADGTVVCAPEKAVI